MSQFFFQFHCKDTTKNLNFQFFPQKNAKNLHFANYTLQFQFFRHFSSANFFSALNTIVSNASLYV